MASGAIYASVSTEPPLYRLPRFERHSLASKDGWKTKVLFLPRPRSLDPRVRRIDIALDMDKLSVYVSTKGPFNEPATLSAENGTTTAEEAGGPNSAANETVSVQPAATAVHEAASQPA